MSEKKDRTPKSNELSQAAARLGAAGGKVGGPARDAALTHEEKSKIAAEGGRAKAAKAKDHINTVKKSKRKKGD